jgi:hypothetical protein
MLRIALSFVIFFIGWALRSGAPSGSINNAYGGILIAIGLFGICINVYGFMKTPKKPQK